jgi:hypothetical protein
MVPVVMQFTAAVVVALGVLPREALRVVTAVKAMS